MSLFVHVPLSYITGVALLAIYTNLARSDRQKLLLSMYLIYMVIATIIQFIIIIDTGITNVDEIIKIPSLVLLLLISITIYSIITILIYWETRKSSLPITRLKGKLMLIGFFIFVVGAFLLILFVDNLIALVINQGLQVVQVVAYYFAFAMPNVLAKRFSQE